MIGLKGYFLKSVLELTAYNLVHFLYKMVIKRCKKYLDLELFYLNSILNFGIPPVLVFKLEVYYKAGRLITGLTDNKKEQLLEGLQIKHLYRLTYFVKMKQG